MNGYNIALFFHMLGLGIAAGTTALVKLALGRRTKARTVGEMLEWHSLLMKSAPFFPISLVTLLLSGGYMVSTAKVPWSTAFITAGLVAIGFLLVVGGLLGATGRKFTRKLEALAATGANQAPPRPEPAFATMLSYGNVGLVLGVVFDMSTKQTSVPIALAALAIGFIAGALVGKRAGA